MSWDNSVVTHLNNWGQSHVRFVHFLSNDLVYLSLLLALGGFAWSQWGSGRSVDLSVKGLWKSSLDAIFILIIPIALATIISEIISRIFPRDRPFVAMSNIKLLIPHGADGGMPSHHMVFMFALGISLIQISRNIGFLVCVLTPISGIARIAAGIHYPSDIIVGLALGAAVAWIYFAVKTRLIKIRY
jgi:membrane-associated phospholipid phosphatase